MALLHPEATWVDRKIKTVREYMDTYHVVELMGPVLAAAEGAEAPAQMAPGPA